MTLSQVFEAAGLGLAAGVVGGLAGIGGSLIMLPGLALVMGSHAGPHNEQHVFAAAAMAVNVAVAVPAALRHAKAHAVDAKLATPLIPAMILAVIGGVLASNRVSGAALRYILAAFIASYCCWNISVLLRGKTDPATERAKLPILAGIGIVAGFAAGLLGIGGGAIVVPALQLLCGVRLRQAIGTSNAAMVGSALVGATIKWATLGQHGRSWTEAALLAAAMAPGAVLGGTAGARLAHGLPLKMVRLAVSCILMASAIRLAQTR
jgi:uncharacterized membrane protein YfcA